MNFSTQGITPTKKSDSLKNVGTSLLLAIALIFVGQMSFAQATYTWNGGATASWATAGSWSPTRTTPAVNDILVFNNGITITPTAIPTQTIGQLQVSGASTIVNLQAAGANTLTIGAGIAGADLSVASGSQLNITGANALQINVSTGNTGNIIGNMSFTNAAHTLTAADATGITFSSPSVFTQGTGCTGNVFGSGTSNSIVFATGTTFAQSAGANPFQKTQPASVVVFQTGNLFRLLQSSAPSFSGRTYANFEYNPGSGTQSPTGGSAFVCDNLTVTTGTLNIGMTGTPGHAIKGNISVASGATLAFNPSSAGTMNFNGSGASQTISNSGTLTFNANQAIVIANTATTPSVTFNQAQTISGSMTVNSGSILAIGGGTLALTGTPAINGSFQINQGGFASGGTWSYGAGGTLIYNNSSGSFGENGGAYWPTTNAPTNVTVAGAGGLTLNVARTVSGTFQTAAGVTNANNITANGTLQINGGGFLTGTPTYGASSTLVYNTTSYTTSTNEFPNTGVKNVTITSPSTNTVTLDNDKTITGTFAIGAHTVNGGKSIDAATITIGAGSLVAGTLTTSSAFTCSGSSSISLTGSWNVTGFTRSTSTVTFTNNGNLNANSTFYNLTNSGGTRSITSSFGVENILLVSGGNMQVSGGSGKTLTMSGATSTINITNGSITGTDASAGNDLTLLISGAQTTLTGNATSNDDHEKKFFNVTVNNGSTLGLSRGILCRYGSFSVAGTIQINANGYIQTNPSSSVVPSYNASTGSLTYNNGGPFTTTGEWPGSNSPANVSLIAAGTNVTLSGNRTISGILTLTDGTITTSSNTLAVSNSATAAVVRTNGYVIGNLQRAVATGTNTYAYAVGTSSGYTPASIAFSGTTGAGSVTVVSLNGASSNYPSALSATKRVARYWTVTNSGVSGFTAAATFTYLGADLVGGATQSSVKPYKFDAPSTFSYPSSSTGTLSFTESGITSFSEFGAGECGTVTVNPITGYSGSLCIGSTVQLASTTPGGVWSSDGPTIASVNGTGLVTANLNGSTTIRYTVTDISGCTGEATQAVTVLPNYTINASSTGHGTIAPNGITTLCQGANQHYTITPDACYHIQDVTLDGNSQGPVSSLDVNSISANHTIVASFAIDTYTITVTQTANGTIAPGTGVVNCGSNNHYTITPDACYHIVDVVVDGNSQGPVTSVDINNVSANHTITATYAIDTYTITVTQTANGTIAPGTGVVNCGSNNHYTITPDACYHIVDVVVDGNSQGPVTSVDINNVSANHTITATYALSTYTITVTQTANGTIAPGTGVVNCGSNNHYTITPDACYAIVDVVVDGNSQGPVTSVDLNNVSANHTITATYAPITYTITVTQTANGTIAPGTGVVNCGSNNHYTITPDACYQIVDVVVDGNSQGPVTSVDLNNVSANHTITATYALITYTITVTQTANGTIAPGTGVVNCGSNNHYTITPDACYQIVDVVVDGNSQGPVTSVDLNNVSANHTITATYALITYTITVTQTANGTIAPGTGVVNCGSNNHYTITPDACYAIVDVLVDGNSQGPVTSVDINNVSANHTITATYAPITYTITVTQTANGTIAPGTGVVNCGSNNHYTITPDACYAIVDVLVDGNSQGPVTSVDINNVTANHTITATYALITYTITVTQTANGTIAPGTGVVNCGSNNHYTITPDACYAIVDVVVDGNSQGPVTSVDINNVSANHTITATYAPTTYTITVTQTANGTIAPGTGVVNCGSNNHYTITPDACYAIVDVVVDGNSQGPVTSVDLNNVTANHTITATYAPITYTITVTQTANGTIAPGTGVVNCGSNNHYTITPDACYAIVDVVVDGNSQGPVTSVDLNNVTANHTITATYAPITYTITVTQTANGTIAPGTGVVNCGSNNHYTITPDACYAIVDVVVDGNSQGPVTSVDLNNVSANHTITATYALITYTITVTQTANGTIAPGTGVVNCGSNNHYTITPDACYAIVDVVVDGNSQGPVTSVDLNNVSANHTITATYALITYTITVTQTANGTIAPGTGVVNCGSNNHYTITPDACYAIVDVFVDGNSQGPVTSVDLNNVSANHTITATYAPTTYTITVTQTANGTIAPGTGVVNCGSNNHYTITPDACYAIVDVVVDGNSQGPVTSVDINNVSANHTITATYAPITYTITVTQTANGTIAPGTGVVNCGSNNHYTITPDACYAIVDVVVDGNSQGPVTSVDLNNVSANHTITATYAPTTYTITVTQTANGTIAPGTGVVNCGSNNHYTITPDACYHIVDVVVDGNSQGPVTSVDINNVTANHTITATYAINTYTITVTQTANGTIAPGTAVVNCGSNNHYTITPGACYHIVDVVVDGNSQGPVTSVDINNVSANHTITATYAINTPLAAPVVAGPTNVCPYIGTGDQVVYTATSAGATGFTWVIPPTNVTIISGQGTGTLTVTFQNGFAAQANKQLRVTATSACGNSPMTIYYLLVQTPSTPQPIVGTTSVCSVIGTPNTLTYTIPSVPGATSYGWLAQQPGNVTITHPNGTGVNDTTVNISFGAGFTSSSITVTASNGCGTSGIRSLALTKTNPSQPGLISGPTNACPYMAPNGVAASYSIVPVSGATSYTWTVPVGAIGFTGQGTTSISFTYPNTFVSGSVSVTATNGCGTSVARSLSITKLAPATPSVIDVIQVASCPDRIYTYTLTGMPANATSVQWTVPAGGTITNGQGTSSITVSYSVASVNGNVTAQAINNCGSSTIRTSAVKLGSCQGERSITTKGSTVPATTASVESMQVSVFPNPTVSDFKLQVVTAGKQTINVRILDAQGRSIKTFTVMPYQTINVGSELKAGAYIMEVRQGSEVKLTKLLKF
ncbi:MAG: T9SS type A sorting domain-containing protein [Ferruginibacter sp.]